MDIDELARHALDALLAGTKRAARGVAARAGDAVAERVSGMVEERLARDDHALAALTRAREDPDNPRRLHSLEALLMEILDEDASFAEALERQVNEAQNQRANVPSNAVAANVSVGRMRRSQISLGPMTINNTRQLRVSVGVVSVAVLLALAYLVTANTSNDDESPSGSSRSGSNGADAQGARSAGNAGWLLPAGQLSDDGDGWYESTAILTSSEGHAWAERATVDGTLLAVATDGAGSWVGVGHDGRSLSERETMIVVGDGGSSWATVAGPRRGGALNAVEYDGSFWVAVGGDREPDDEPEMQGHAEAFIVTSTDGNRWSTARVEPDDTYDLQSPAGEFNDVAHDGDGAWVAVGELGIWASRDGRAWEQVGQEVVDGELYGVDHSDGGLWVAVGDSQILTSHDGLAWVERESPVSETEGLLYGVTADDATGLWVAVGDQSFVVLTSTDGIRWSERPLPPIEDGSYSLWSVATHNGLWVVSGLTAGEDPVLLTSPDGSAWTSRPLPGPVQPLRPAFGPAG